MKTLKETRIFDGYDHNQIEKYSYKAEITEEKINKYRKILITYCNFTNDELIIKFDEIFGKFSDDTIKENEK